MTGLAGKRYSRNGCAYRVVKEAMMIEPIHGDSIGAVIYQREGEGTTDQLFVRATKQFVAMFESIDDEIKG